MEAAARHRRTKSAASIEGNLQSQRQKSSPILSSYSCAAPKENLLQNSVKQGSGTPIKKLLAQEMVKDNETRKKQPSVIARLMGLDGLPSPQPIHKQQRKLEKNVKQTASTYLPQKEQYFEDQPSRIESIDQPEFKDVYEDMEASHVMSHRCSSRWTTNSRLLKPEMAHLQQKFTRKKSHPSYDELNGTLSIIDSTNELLLKYLEHPDVLFLKHYRTLQDDPSSSPYSHMSSLELSNSVEHQGYAKVQRLTRDGVHKHDNTRKKRADGLLLQSHNHQGSRNSWQLSRNQANVKDDVNPSTTRIVVLKPNIGKRVNTTCVPSPESSHASSPTTRKRLQYTGSSNGDTLSCRKKNSSRKTFSSNSTSRECEDVSKESTMETIKYLEPSTGLRGYAGDESSYDAYESDSSSASEVMMMSSRNSFDGSDWVRRSSSGPFESVVSKEARKRLSERWKMASKFQSSEPSAKVSTLGEMLAVPEKDSVQQHAEAGTALDESSERFLGSSNSSGWDGPRGISSRDGWKEGYIRTSSRSRSLPPSIGNRNRKTHGRRETNAGDCVKKEKDTRKIKSRKGDLRNDGDISEKDDILSNFKSDPCLDKFVDNSGSSRDVSSYQVRDVNFSQRVQHESNFVCTQAPHRTDSSGCSIRDLPTNVEPEPLPLSSDPFTNLYPKHGDSFIPPDGSSARNQEDIALEEPVLVSEAKSASFESCGLELESYESSKEADHCSPVSVLEVPFPEDVSCSPDSFEIVNAKIKQLRIELQLLKMESDGCTDTPMPLSNNLDTMQRQPGKIFEEEQIVGDDTWESSYIDDMLLFSGLEDFHPNTLNLASWHSPECPIGLWVYNSLEKKYTDERTELKFERRLLFDLVNSALLELFQQYISRSYSLQPLMIGVPKWQRHGIKEHLKEMLFRQENMMNKEKLEITLDREMNWLGFRDSVKAIGEDIEKLLIDDLIEELLTV